MTATAPDVMAGAHACAVAVSDEHRWEITSAFVAAGLVRDERVVYFDDGTIDFVLGRLADDRVPVAGPLTDGQLSIISSDDTRALMRTPVSHVQKVLANAIDESLARGYTGMRMTGQFSYALSRPGGVALHEYCGGLDLVLDGRPARVLCLFDPKRFPDDDAERLRRQHREELIATAVYDDALLRITRTGPSQARLAGEVDHSNRPMIARLLENILDESLRSHSAPTDVTVNLATLRFLDVAGAVSLVHAAEQFPSTHRLVLSGVRPRVLRVLDRCGAPFAAQLVLTAHPGPGSTDMSPADVSEPDVNEAEL
ncbi:MAG: MEDS domain-containing protein [Pseudonocardia sp.]